MGERSVAATADSKLVIKRTEHPRVVLRERSVSDISVSSVTDWHSVCRECVRVFLRAIGTLDLTLPRSRAIHRLASRKRWPTVLAIMY